MIDENKTLDKRPSDLDGKTIRIDTACGNMYVTINSTVKKPIFEVFAVSGKSGSCSAAVVDALTKTISIALRSGVDPEVIIEHIIGIGCPKSGVNENSCPEGIAKAMKHYLEEEYEEIIVELDEEDYNEYDKMIEEVYDGEVKKQLCECEEESEDNSNLEICPECGEKAMGTGEGCGLCLNCGYSPCK